LTAPAYRRKTGKHQFKGIRMSWTTPRVVEISVGMEINCYACADI
jgi:coenzyme PQQ precursor peptide PqqA